MKKALALIGTFLVLIFFAIPVFGEKLLAEDGLGSYIQEEFQKTHFPGMSVQIVDAENILFTQTYGNCTSLDAPFIIGSISKSFTAVSIMQLVEQGKINIDNPAADYIPEFKKASKTTVRQLLNQSSGIKTYDTLESYTSADTQTAYAYANTNYGLLGQIVENVSGMSYQEYVQANIFAPLSMSKSFTSLEQAKANGLEPGYRNYFGIMVKQEMPYPQNSRKGWITIPAGYILSSTNDMGRYLQMYLGNTNNVLSEESINTMIFENVEAAENYMYGMGLGLDYRSGELLVVHGGNMENYTTYMIIMPERGIAMIAMFNGGDFFVANEMAIQLSYNIMNKYLGIETSDIEKTAYVKSHALITTLLIIILLLSFLPLMLIKKWAAKISEKTIKKSIVLIPVFHIILPTVLLLVVPLLGIPLFVVRGFVPDVFLVLVISSSALYLTGIFKFIFLIRYKKAA